MSQVLWLLCWLALACSAYGQSVTRQVWNARTPTNGQSTALPNIGQSQHTVRVQYADAGGSCAIGAGLVNLYLEASTDGGVNWFPISPRSLLLNNLSGVLVANGVYPSLRINSQSSLFNCSISAWYSGSTSALAYSQLPLASTLGYFTSLGAALTGASGPATNAVAGSRVVVYGLTVNNLGGPRLLELFFAPDTSCASNLGTLMYVNVPDGATSPPPAIWPSSVVPIGYGPVGAALCKTMTGAGGSGAGSLVQVVFRYE